MPPALPPPPTTTTSGDTAAGVGAAAGAIRHRLPSVGGVTSVGSRAMRLMPVIVVLVSCCCGLLESAAGGSPWIFRGIPAAELDEAKDIGRKGSRLRFCDERAAAAAAHSAGHNLLKGGWSAGGARSRQTTFAVCGVA